MKKEIVILLFLSIVMTYLCSCNKLSGVLGTSHTMEEAKRRGVFISTYWVPENPYMINDSIVLDVKEIWLEKRWRFGERINSTSPMSGYQMVFAVKGNGFQKYTQEWFIGVEPSLYFRHGMGKTIIGDFNELPKDTIIIPIQKRMNLSEHQEKDVFAEFKLFRVE